VHVLAAAAAVTALLLAGCNAQAPHSAISPSPGSDCDAAFELATLESNVDAVRVALVDAMSSCRTADEWARASQERAGGLQGVDPQQFLVDRCLNGPPDIAESNICQGMSVNR